MPFHAFIFSDIAPPSGDSTITVIFLSLAARLFLCIYTEKARMVYLAELQARIPTESEKIP